MWERGILGTRNVRGSPQSVGTDDEHLKGVGAGIAHTVPLQRAGAFMEEEVAELSVEREEKLYRQPRLRGQPCEDPEVQGWGGVLRKEAEEWLEPHHMWACKTQEEFGPGPAVGGKHSRVLRDMSVQGDSGHSVLG